MHKKPLISKCCYKNWHYVIFLGEKYQIQIPNKNVSILTDLKIWFKIGIGMETQQFPILPTYAAAAAKMQGEKLTSHFKAEQPR